MNYTIRIGYRWQGDSYVFEEVWPQSELQQVMPVMVRLCQTGFFIGHPRHSNDYVSCFVPPAAVTWAGIREEDAV